jgi:outer membrane protein OmpA-like peptidoglycan-associated protein
MIDEVKVMKMNTQLVVGIAVSAALAACSVTPERIEPLETARTVVPQVESSPRAGVAAVNIADARKSLEEANRLAEADAKLSDIEFQAQNAITHARIAQEKILTVEAQEQIAQGTEQRQVVLLKARERDVQKSAQQASDSRQDARDSQDRVDSLEEELAGLRLEKTERGLVLTLGDVLFDSGQATLKTGAYGTIDRLASALRDKSDRSVAIEGHTDNVGTDAMNQALSERRAQSVQSALMQRGVTSSQVTAMGKGETFPVASNDDAGGRQQNRRVELIFASNQQRMSER